MTQFRETVSIAGITMAVDSPREFQLTDRVAPFRSACETPDVTLTLCQGGDFDEAGMELLHRGERRTLWRRGRELVYACRDGQTKELRWFTCQQAERPEQVAVHVLAEDIWQRFNPLTFVELSDFMIRRGAMILHSSLIDHQGRGIVFTAPSGTGKSTQADLWHKYRGAEILNGDRSIIRREGSGYRCYGSPYAGSSGIYQNKSVALGAVVVLRQAPKNRIRRMKAREAYLCLLSEMSLSPIDRETVEKQSQWLLDLISAVPVYLLECLPDEGAVDALWGAMEGEL